MDDLFSETDLAAPRSVAVLLLLPEFEALRLGRSPGSRIILA